MRLFYRIATAISLCFVAQFVFVSKVKSQQVDTARSIITPSSSGAINPADAVTAFEKMENSGKHHDSLNILTNAFNADKRLDSVQLSAWKSYYTYMDVGYKHRANVFAWQLFSSRMIFCVVVLLVLCGIYFAWLQFRVALKRMQKDKTDVGAALLSDITASAKELKVSSPVLGVIILVISLLFFYLYLVHVYPIQETF